jgi:hypothetical protein
MTKGVKREGKSKTQPHEPVATRYQYELDETASGLVDLQQSIGNRAVHRLIAKPSEDRATTLAGSTISRTVQGPGIAQSQEREALPMKVERAAKVQRWGPEDEEVQAAVMRQKAAAKPRIKPPAPVGISIPRGSLGRSLLSLYKGVTWCQDAILKVASKLGLY